MAASTHSNRLWWTQVALCDVSMPNVHMRPLFQQWSHSYQQLHIHRIRQTVEPTRFDELHQWQFADSRCSGNDQIRDTESDSGVTGVPARVLGDWE